MKMGRIKKSLFGAVFTDRQAAKIAEKWLHLEKWLVARLSGMERRLSLRQKKWILIGYLLLSGGYLGSIAFRALTTKTKTHKQPPVTVSPSSTRPIDTTAIKQQR